MLGIWLILSPWTLAFWTDTAALRNASIVGALLIGVEVVTLTAFRSWEEGANIVLGAWCVVSPFVLGFKRPVVMVDFVAVGILVVALALNELREIGRHRAVGA